MCCKNFWKRIIPFILAFAVGIFIASFYVLDSKENSFPKQKDFKTETAVSLFDPPKLPECKNYINELRKKQSGLKKWIAENQNISKKQKKSTIKEIKEIETQIKVYGTLKQFSKNSPELESNYKNLLYKENCYEF